MTNIRRTLRITTETGKPAYVTAAGVVTLFMALTWIAADFIPVWFSLIAASVTASFGTWLLFQAEILRQRQAKRHAKERKQ